MEREDRRKVLMRNVRQQSLSSFPFSSLFTLKQRPSQTQRVTPTTHIHIHTHTHTSVCFEHPRLSDAVPEKIISFTLVDHGSLPAVSTPVPPPSTDKRQVEREKVNNHTQRCHFSPPVSSENNESHRCRRRRKAAVDALGRLVVAHVEGGRARPWQPQRETTSECLSPSLSLSVVSLSLPHSLTID